jgi:hypothetical protein
MQIIWRFLGRRPDLAVMERRPLSPGVEHGPAAGDRRDRYERVVAHEAPGDPEPEGPYRRLAHAIRAYQVFPPSWVTGVLRRAPVQPGDTYGICYHVLPGIELFFAGRVTASFDERVGDTWRAGFSFRTVQGHPELGEETFFVKKDVAGGAVRVGLQSWSRPGTWLTRLVRPYTRWVQVRACYAALDQLQQVAVLQRKLTAIS